MIGKHSGILEEIVLGGGWATKNTEGIEKIRSKIQKQKAKGLACPALNLQIKSTVVGYFFPPSSITLIVSLPSNGVPSVSSPVTIRVTSAGSSISKTSSI